MRDWAALVVGALVYAASAGWAAGRLPATGVPVHFDAAGRVVLVGSRAEVVTLWVGLGVGMLALGVALVLFVRRGPLRIMNIPHRTHWMAIQRQPVLRRMLSADVAGVMGVTIVFLSFVPLWTVQALTAPDRTVAPVLFWGPLAVFAVGVVCWAVWLPLRRYRPRDAR